MSQRSLVLHEGPGCQSGTLQGQSCDKKREREEGRRMTAAVMINERTTPKRAEAAMPTAQKYS